VRRILLLTLAAFVGACGDSKKEPAGSEKPAPEKTRDAEVSGRWIEVQRRSVSQDVPAVGSFEARQTTMIGPQVAGRVQEIFVDVGDGVRRGERLMKLDPIFFVLAVRQRKSEVTAAQARVETQSKAISTAESEVERVAAVLEDAELDLRRMKNLWEKPQGQAPSIPRQRYDRAVFKARQSHAAHAAATRRVDEAGARLREAEAAVSARQVDLARAEEELKETMILAPFDGVVTRRLVDTGERVNATPVTHVLEIQETGVLELVFALPQSFMARVVKGTPVRFHAEGVENGAGEGTVAVIHPDLDPKTRSVRYRVSVDNSKGLLRPGLLAQLDILLKSAPDAVAIPRAALRQDDAGWFVTVKKENQPVRRNVVVGVVGPKDAEIRRGLSPDDLVRVER